MFINKKLSNIIKIAITTCLPLTFNALAVEFEFSGKINLEERSFFEEGQYQHQFDHTQSSLAVAPELYWGWNNDNDRIIFQPYYRLDSQDNERTHADIRELSYLHSSDNWELRTGIRREFWGVTEFQHLVDVINQSDAVDTFGGEEKLGQLMLNFSVAQDWGIVDLFILPGFRERTVVGEEGRLRSSLIIDSSNVNYESGAKDKHVDLAVRWTHALGDFDLGSYWFHGTNRAPVLSLAQGNTKLVQYYNQMDQLGIDVQATLGDWLWKFESIYRTTSDEDFAATQAGFEYTYVGIFDSNADLGILTEHSWDSRGESGASSYQNDLFVGARIALNDIQSSELLMGLGSDIDHNAFSYVLEASRRLGDNFKLNLDVRLVQSSESTESLYALNDDDHMQLAVEWYF